MLDAYAKKKKKNNDENINYLKFKHDKILINFERILYNNPFILSLSLNRLYLEREREIKPIFIRRDDY